MATVYLAHDIKHDRKVAVKVLRPKLAAVVGAERLDACASSGERQATCSTSLSPTTLLMQRDRHPSNQLELASSLGRILVRSNRSVHAKLDEGLYGIRGKKLNV